MVNKLIFALLLLATPVLSQSTRTYTVAVSGGDYTTLTAAEADLEQDLVANDSDLTIEISGLWSGDPEGAAVSITGWNQSATQNLTIRGVDDSRAGTTWKTDAWFVKGFYVGIQVFESFVTIDGLQIGTLQGNSNCLNVGTSGDSSLVVSNCFFNGEGSNVRGVLLNSGDETTNQRIRNNIFLDCDNQGVLINGGQEACAYVDNNTFFDCGSGIVSNPTKGTIARNNIFWGVTTPTSGGWDNSPEISNNNWTDLSDITYTGCGGCGADDTYDGTDPFEDEPGEDLAQATGASTIDNGEDLSGDFTDAIASGTRGATWDQGAHEFVAAGDPDTLHPQKVLIKISMIYWNQIKWYI